LGGSYNDLLGISFRDRVRDIITGTETVAGTTALADDVKFSEKELEKY